MKRDYEYPEIELLKYKTADIMGDSLEDDGNVNDDDGSQEVIDF